MKKTPYTTLLELIRQGDAQLKSIVEQCSATGRRCRPQSSYNLSALTAPSPVTHTDAKVKTRKILDIIRGAKGDYYKGMMELQSELTMEGTMRLFQLLLSKLNEQEDDELVDAFTNPMELVPALFTGVPLYNIVVEDARPLGKDCKNKEEKREGRYDIYLEKVATNERFKIPFDHREAKALYLWFLQHPATEYGANSIKKEMENISEIFNRCYYCNNNTLEEKIKNKDVKVGTRGRTGYDEFWLQAKPKAKRAVTTVLGERDIKDWYIINTDRRGENWSLSLPKDYINLPDSLTI